jgi:hypothetical protein
MRDVLERSCVIVRLAGCCVELHGIVIRHT